MNFKIYQEGKEITCEIIMAFKDEANNINYVVYTDGTKDEDGDLEIYASRYVLKNNQFLLEAIESDYEWNLVDNMLEAKLKEVEE